MTSIVKLAQELDDLLTDYKTWLPNVVEKGEGLEDLYALRSVISDCIVLIERKDGRIL